MEKASDPRFHTARVRSPTGYRICEHAGPLYLPLVLVATPSPFLGHSCHFATLTICASCVRALRVVFTITSLSRSPLQVTVTYRRSLHSRNRERLLYSSSIVLLVTIFYPDDSEREVGVRPDYGASSPVLEARRRPGETEPERGRSFGAGHRDANSGVARVDSEKVLLSGAYADLDWICFSNLLRCLVGYASYRPSG
ncbi:hypothetical protein B0H12DRAFT_1172419 [Mycena haematopus]|nr:hypothetical protein B0H12DRAFT_1172419 [Mycena haematopus]